MSENEQEMLRLREDLKAADEALAEIQRTIDKPLHDEGKALEMRHDIYDILNLHDRQRSGLHQITLTFQEQQQLRSKA